MNVIAFNGSPRKKWNTATLLEKAIEGAASHGAETEHPLDGSNVYWAVNTCCLYLKMEYLFRYTVP